MIQRLRLPLIILLLALLALFHRLLLGEVFFWGLPSLQFYPWREYAFDLLRQGQLPLWNPYNGAGAPLLANYQSGLLYPPNWLTFFLPLAWSMSLLAVAHLLLAGWGMWAFTGRLGLTPLGRGVSALVFALTGYLVGRLGTYPIIMAAAWLPWLMWAALGVMRQFKRRDGAWLALFAALMLLAGHAQVSWYTLLLVGVFSLWYGLSQPLTPPFTWWWERPRRIGAVAALLLLGAGVAALQLIPTAELLATSQRGSGVDYEFAVNFSYHPLRTLNLLSPNIFGNPAFGTYNAQQGVFFEYAVYAGLIPLVSAIAALLHWLRGGRQSLFISVPFWWIIILVGFVLAVGQHAPIFPFLYRSVPTFDLFQAPVRWHLWTVFALAVVAGIGVGAWGRGVRVKRWSRLMTTACIGIVVLASIALPVLGGEGNQGMQILLAALVMTATFAALAGLLTLRQPEAETPRHARWSALVLLVIALDLVIAGWGLNPTVTGSFYERGSTTDEGRAYWFASAENTVAFETYFTFDDYRIAGEQWQPLRTTHLPNLNLIDRRPLLNNFDPLRVGAFDRYLALVEVHPDQPNLLQAAGVEAVYDERGGLQALTQPMPRAWLVGSVCWHETVESLESALTDPTWNPAAQVHLLGDAGCPAAVESPARAGSVAIDDSAAQVTLTVAAPRQMWLVLADVDYPGWRAAVDGEPVPIYTANLAFRAVQVPAGQSNVTFSYEAWWLLPGMIVSGLSLLAVVVLFRSREVTL